MKKHVSVICLLFSLLCVLPLNAYGAALHRKRIRIRQYHAIKEVLNLINFIIGSMLGGFLTTVILCCFQINRVNSYEQEIRRLKAQLADSEK